MGLWTSQSHLSHRWSLSEQKLVAAALGRGVGVRVSGEGCAGQHSPAVTASKKEWQ